MGATSWNDEANRSQPFVDGPDHKIIFKNERAAEFIAAVVAIDPPTEFASGIYAQLNILFCLLFHSSPAGHSGRSPYTRSFRFLTQHFLRNLAC